MNRVEWEALSRTERLEHADLESVCYESGCRAPAGTPWGPHWCADHDDERIARISGQMADIVEQMGTDR